MFQKNSKNKGLHYFPYYECILYSIIVIIAAVICYCITNVSLLQNCLIMLVWIIILLGGLSLLMYYVRFYEDGLLVVFPLKFFYGRYSIPYCDIISIQFTNAMTLHTYAYKIQYYDNKKHKKTIRFIAPISLKTIKKIENVFASHNIDIVYICPCPNF